MTQTLQAPKMQRAGLRGWAARRPNTALVLAYTGVFALLMGVWIAIFAASGKSFMQYGDTIKQHYTSLMYYGRWLREAARCLLGGLPVPTWDSTIGYGADIITTLSYYVIGDPLDLLAALVPSQYTELLLEALIVLRVYLGGLAFIPYSLHHRNTRFGTLLGAVSFAFCGWTLQIATIEPIFLVPMYCFPLVLLGADDIFEGRRPTLYIAAIALSALSNFLFFYMIAVLLVLYAVARYFRTYGVKRLRTLWPLLGKFIGYSLVGIAISCVTMLPTLIEMFGSARFTLERQTVWYPFTYYFKVFSNLTTSAAYDVYSTFSGITAAAVLGVMILFARRKKDTVLKWAWLALLAFIMIPWVGKALNGFSYMQNRWIWAFAMLEAFILARVAPDMTELTGSERLTLFALLAGWCAVAFWNVEARTEWALLGAVLLLLLAVFVLSAEAKAAPRLTRGVLLAGCCMGVVINLGYTFGVDESVTFVEYKDPGFAWDANVAGNPANVLKQLDDDTYWRYDSAMSDYINSAMLMDLHGTGYFWSLHNSYLSQLFKELGQNTPTEYDYKGLDKRGALESLFGVKYFLCGPDSANLLPVGFSTKEVLAMDVGGVMCGVYGNLTALPIGFTAGSRITRAEYDALTPAQRQDALLSAVLLEDDAETNLPASTAHNQVARAEAQTTLNGVELTDEGVYYSPQDGGTISFVINTPAADCESYLVVEGFQYTATNPYEAMGEDELTAMSKYDRLQLEKQYAHFWCKEKVYLRLISDLGEGRIDYFMPNNQYYCGRHDFVYNFGHSETGLTTLTIVLPYAGYYSFDTLAVEYQPVGDLAERAAALAAESLQNVTLGANTITGNIAVSGSKVLVMQIPYSAGWSAMVDGEPAALLRADTAFLGVELAAGEHTIELHYETPGLKIGLLLSAAGLLAFAGIAVWPRRKKRAGPDAA